MPVLSTIEIVIFVVLLAASAFGFWWRFSKVVKKIEASKSDPGFSLHPLGKRVWDFFSEVMLQSKVIKERPLPGIAHAFVFWGFCAFALVTMGHLAAGLGVNLLPTDYAVVRGYRYFVALFAIAVAV